MMLEKGKGTARVTGMAMAANEAIMTNRCQYNQRRSL